MFLREFHLNWKFDTPEKSLNAILIQKSGLIDCVDSLQFHQNRFQSIESNFVEST